MSVTFGALLEQPTSTEDRPVDIYRTPFKNLEGFNDMVHRYGSTEMAALACCVPDSALYMERNFGDEAGKVLGELVGILKGDSSNYGELRVTEVRIAVESTDAAGNLLVYPEVHFVREHARQLMEYQMSIAGFTSIRAENLMVTTQDYVGNLFNPALLNSEGVLDTIKV